VARYRTPVGAGCQHFATTQLAKVGARCRAQLLALFLERPYAIDVCSALGMETPDGRKAVSRAAFALRLVGATIRGFRGRGYRWHDPGTPERCDET
jgi:biotin operon repressor